MIDRFEELPFPGPADFDALVEEAGPNGLRTILAQEGVFVLGKRETWSFQLQRFTFGQRWYAEVFHAPHAMLSGTVFTAIRTKFGSVADASAAASDLIGTARTSTHKPTILAVFRRSGVDVVSVSFTKNRAFRTEYYRRETRTIELRVEEVDGRVLFSGFPGSATDAMVMRDVAKAVVDEATSELDEIDLDKKLTQDERIELFDSLLEDRSSTWRVRDVVGLAVRRSKTTQDETLEEGDVRALSAAILSGSSLRKLTMVQDLIDAGCHFVSARFLAFAPSMVGVGGDVDVEVAFKQSPEVLMITVRTTRQLRNNDDGTQTEEAVKTPMEVAEKVARFYWSRIHAVYDRIIGARSAAKPTA